MKLLLTSAGIKNASISQALVKLLGKPIAESSALVIPTASHPGANGTSMAYRLISGLVSTPLCELGWKSLGVLELCALPTVPLDHWLSALQAADALLVGGGDPAYLVYWMQHSGLAERLATLPPALVYVGVSAGSMALTPRLGKDFLVWQPPTGGDQALGVVDFSIFPHLDHEKFPDNSLAGAKMWAAEIAAPAYAIDDQTALQVVDGAVEVITEGHWQRFTP